MSAFVALAMVAGCGEESSESADLTDRAGKAMPAEQVGGQADPPERDRAERRRRAGKTQKHSSDRRGDRPPEPKRARAVKRPHEGVVSDPDEIRRVVKEVRRGELSGGKKGSSSESPADVAADIIAGEQDPARDGGGGSAAPVDQILEEALSGD